MKKTILKVLLFLVPFVLVVLLLLIIPISKKFAYHFIEGNCYNHGAWIYDRVFENQTPVDVVFIGSSRTLHSINEKEIERHIVEKTGDDIRIANIGFCRMGRNLLHAMLSDLLKHKKPKLVVIEITEDEGRTSNDTYPYIADAKDIVFSHFYNPYYFTDLFKAIVLRWEFYKAKLIFGIDKYPYNSSNYGYGSSTRIVNEHEIENNKKYWTKRLQRDHSSMIGKFLDSYPFYFFNNSVELLNDEGVEFCFLFIPSANEEIDQSVFNDMFEALGKVYTLSPAKYNKKEYWMDATHFNDTGSKMVATDVADFVIEEMCLTEN